MDNLESNACSSTYPSEVTITAEIVNQTHQVLDMKLGNSVYFVHMAHLARGATHTVLVDYSDTYQEYKFSPLRSSTGDSSSSSSSNLVVTSDECCDYKRIIITEVDGQLTVQREPRVHSGVWNLQNISAAAPPPPPPPPEAPNRDCRSDVGDSNWRWWIRLRLF